MTKNYGMELVTRPVPTHRTFLFGKDVTSPTGAGHKLVRIDVCKTTPPIVQAYIAGKDVRVHVVGEQVFPTVVQSDAVDYRFEGTEVTYQAIDMPRALAQKCIDFTQRADLLLSGFDFRVTPQNEWYCLEMNPVPTFMPYELATGQPIGNAIVRALMVNTPLQRVSGGLRANGDRQSPDIYSR